jgi:hypothetical protein
VLLPAAPGEEQAVKIWTLDEIRAAQNDLEALRKRLRLTRSWLCNNELVTKIEVTIMRAQGYRRYDEEVMEGDLQDRLIACAMVMERLLEEQMKAQEAQVR